MPCPWYQNGLCTSPKLVKPTSAVTDQTRCLGGPEQYKTCNFYVEPGGEKSEEKSGLLKFTQTGLEKKLRPYPPIHLLEHRPSCGCPYMRVYEYGGGYLAYCTVLERLLTISEIKICENHWRTCPIKKVGAVIGRSA